MKGKLSVERKKSISAENLQTTYQSAHTNYGLNACLFILLHTVIFTHLICVVVSLTECAVR